MDTININGFKLNLNFEPQLSKNGKEIRLSGIAKNCQVPTIFFDKDGKIVSSYTKGRIEKNHWIYTFRYIGTETFVSFEFDYLNKFVGIYSTNTKH
jgi:thioredoxin-related protein